MFVCFLGKQIHTMVAHLDAVTSLAVDPNGLYLLSGSKDSSDIFCVSIPQSRIQSTSECLFRWAQLTVLAHFLRFPFLGKVKKINVYVPGTEIFGTFFCEF